MTHMLSFCVACCLPARQYLQPSSSVWQMPPLLLWPALLLPSAAFSSLALGMAGGSVWLLGQISSPPTQPGPDLYIYPAPPPNQESNAPQGVDGLSADSGSQPQAAKVQAGLKKLSKQPRLPLRLRCLQDKAARMQGNVPRRRGCAIYAHPASIQKSGLLALLPTPRLAAAARKRSAVSEPRCLVQRHQADEHCRYAHLQPN
ncbi:hypothetical protein GQ54DRAFT_1040 [Martensiomyces pterosporus]|nr:hypothetical protein GQ54DRAFT_1040 [Martensiomyces pterosporus]